MAVLSADRKSMIKWTLLLLAFASSLASLVIVLLIVLIFAGGNQVNTSGLTIVSLVSAGLVWWILNVRRQLLSGDEAGWSNAIVIAILCAPSVALPFAVLSLNELLRQSNRAAFYRSEIGPNLGIAGTETHQNRNTWSPTRIALTSALVGMALIAAGMKISARLHNHEFQLDAGLSLPELRKMGARCNTDGDLKCSKAVYARVVELDPSDRAALANLAMAESEIGLHAEAIQHFESYFAQGGRGVDAMFFLAKSHDARGDKESALQWCTQALSESANLVDVAEYAARLRLQLGRFQEAETFINDFVSRFPESKPYFAGILRELQSKR